ncbi:MAG: TIGR03013 family XrtA/PEP-CTERM system glycosyltransferase [Pseudomonadota bacterium]
MSTHYPVDAPQQQERVAGGKQPPRITSKFLRHYMNLPVLILAIIEFVILFAAAAIAASVMGESGIGGLSHLWCVVFAVVTSVSFISMGLYRVRSIQRTLGMMVRVALGLAMAGIALMVVFYAVPAVAVDPAALGAALSTALVLIALVRIAFYRLAGEDLFKRRVLVYGAGRKASGLLSLPQRYDMRGFHLLGFVPPPSLEREVADDQVIDLDASSLLHFAREHDVDEIVVAIDDRRNAFPVQELLDCKLRGINVTDAISFVERETGKVKLDLLYPSWMIFSDGFSRNLLHSRVQRIFDVVASLALLALTWWVMLITAFAIWVESGFKHSVLYKQVRVGFEGRHFEVLKFRSMTPDAERGGKAVWAIENDKRVTRVGAVIRKYRIDELPQIFNVLRGDMSFVGPRPERPSFVEELSALIPYYRERHFVKPGITGWAQLCYRYGSSTEDSMEKLQYDLYYLKHRSVVFDLMILLQTAEVVLLRQGAR